MASPHSLQKRQSERIRAHRSQTAVCRFASIPSAYSPQYEQVPSEFSLSNTSDRLGPESPAVVPCIGDHENYRGRVPPRPFSPTYGIITNRLGSSPAASSYWEHLFFITN